MNAEGWTLIGVALGGAIAIIGSLAVASFQIRAAVTQRRQEWRERAYVDAFAVLNRQRQLIALSWPIITPSQAPPPLLPHEVVEAAEAKLESHSSQEMQELLDRWIDRRTEYFSLGARIDFMTTHPEARAQDSSGVWEKLGTVRAELIGEKSGGGIIGEIAAQIRKELGYKD